MTLSSRVVQHRYRLLGVESIHHLGLTAPESKGWILPIGYMTSTLFKTVAVAFKVIFSCSTRCPGSGQWPFVRVAFEA